MPLDELICCFIVLLVVGSALWSGEIVFPSGGVKRVERPAKYWLGIAAGMALVAFLIFRSRR